MPKHFETKFGWLTPVIGNRWSDFQPIVIYQEQHILPTALQHFDSLWLADHFYGLVNSSRPLADVMSLTVGESSAKLMAAIALISTASTVLLALTSASRMIYGTASSGSLPKIFATVYQRRTPLPALLASTAVAIALILFEDISLLAGATDVLIYVLFIIVNLVLIILRKRMPDHPRQFVVRGSIRGLPVLPVLGIIATLSMGFNIERDASLLAIFIVAVGIAISLSSKSGKKSASS